MTMPNFLILGTAKAGTTALYYYLAQHPQIYMSPQKEPKFFAFEGESVDFQGPKDGEGINRETITRVEDYIKLFRGVSNEKAFGEASPWYLYSKAAHKRIKNHTPDAKLIAILRNPVDRAYSHFMHLLRDGREPLADFARAVEEEGARIEANWAWHWHYVKAGFYHDQVKRYLDTFSGDQIKIYLYDDLSSKPSNMLADIFRFLEVDDTFLPDMSIKYNTSGVPQKALLRWYLSAPKPVKHIFRGLTPAPLRRVATKFKNVNLVKLHLPPDVRSQLQEVYREDILKLQDLIHKDLSTWLN